MHDDIIKVYNSLEQFVRIILYKKMKFRIKDNQKTMSISRNIYLSKMPSRPRWVAVDLILVVCCIFYFLLLCTTAIGIRYAIVHSSEGEIHDSVTKPCKVVQENCNLRLLFRIKPFHLLNPFDPAIL